MDDDVETIERLTADVRATAARARARSQRLLSLARDYRAKWQTTR